MYAGFTTHCLCTSACNQLQHTVCPCQPEQGTCVPSSRTVGDSLAYSNLHLWHCWRCPCTASLAEPSSLRFAICIPVFLFIGLYSACPICPGILLSLPCPFTALLSLQASSCKLPHELLLSPHMTTEARPSQKVLAMCNLTCISSLSAVMLRDNPAAIWA